MNVSDGRTLLDYGQWADALLWQAVTGLDRPDAELQQKLHHLHAAQWVYLEVWRGEPVTPSALDAFPTLDALREWARAYHGAALGYLESVPGDDPARDIGFPWHDGLVRRFGPVRPTTWSDSLLQVALHSAYHRGQVARRVRELGGEPPVTDYIAWVWLGRPSARWERPAD